MRKSWAPIFACENLGPAPPCRKRMWETRAGGVAAFSKACGRRAFCAFHRPSSAPATYPQREAADYWDLLQGYTGRCVTVYAYERHRLCAEVEA